ncbi:MAG: hypothetical protein AUI12_05405 [Acidobacteria bacterium 13_2_20CM_2_57_6]|nr:MAG: hypothetical protein AUI12_05405 [Acidobacteria bacterium 13_2_20CM_2_57_6]PYT55141.1 MAG: hypothetical protein DMG46_20455 [Acidobacteriota bacterium]
MRTLVADHRNHLVPNTFQHTGPLLKSSFLVSDLKHHAFTPGYIRESNDLAGWQVYYGTLVGCGSCELLKLATGILQSVHATMPDQGLILGALEEIVILFRVSTAFLSATASTPACNARWFNSTLHELSRWAGTHLNSYASAT